MSAQQWPTLGTEGERIRTVSISNVGAPRGTTRRRVLALLSALPVIGAAALLAGCTSGDGGTRQGRSATVAPTSVAPSADDLARARAVATSRRLLRDVSAATGLPAGVRSAVAAGHRAHLAALGADVEASGTASGTGSTAPAPDAESTSTSTPTVPDGAATTATASTSTSRAAARPTPADVVRGEISGARQALADVAGVSPELATLLVRVAAGRAAHADVVARATDVAVPGAPRAPAGTPTPTATDGAAASGGAPDETTSPRATTGTGPVATLEPEPTTTLDPADLDALDRLTEAEHAAVYGYAVVVPRVAAAREARGRALLDAHRVSRDAIEERVVGAGATPPAALPGYDVDTPTSPADAVALAARIEAGVARVGAWAAGRSGRDVRALAAALAVTSTRRRAEWLGTVPPFEP